MLWVLVWFLVGVLFLCLFFFVVVKDINNISGFCKKCPDLP